MCSINFPRGCQETVAFLGCKKMAKGEVPNLLAMVHSAVQEFNQLIRMHVLVQAHTASKRQS